MPPKKRNIGSFVGLANYQLDIKNNGQKVQDIEFVNCPFGTIDENLALIKATSELNRTNSDKTIHLIVSFSEDEKPTKEVIRDIEKELVKSIGMEEHQRLFVSHDNTNNFHVHIAINRVHPTTHRLANPYQSINKLLTKAAELEEKYGFKSDQTELRKGISHENGREGREFSQSQRRAAVYQSSDRDPGPTSQTQSINSMRTLSQCDVVYHTKGAKELLQVNEHDNLATERTDTDNAVRRTDISDIGDGGGERVKESQKQKDIKAHSGVSNLTTWIKENALEDIKETLFKSTNYKDLHETLAKYNLELKERANGLIIKDKHRNLFIKASEVHRSFSKANIEKQFGEFQAMDIDIKPTTQFGTPKHDFWEKYQVHQEQLKQIKSKEINQLKESYFKDKEALNTTWKERMDFLKQSTNIAKRDKRPLYQTIFQKKKEQLDELYSKYKADKNKVYQTYKSKTYKEYLIQQALTGDTKALEVLRKQKPPKPKEGENTIGDKIDHKLLVSRNPTVTKAGYVIYKPDPSKDQQKIIDKGNHLKVTGADDAALLEALKLGCAKYGQKLNIAGDAEFKTRVIDIVNEHELDIEFKDKKMQDVLESLKAPKQKQKATKPKEKSSDLSI